MRKLASVTTTTEALSKPAHLSPDVCSLQRAAGRFWGICTSVPLMCASIHLHIQQTASAVKKVFLAADLINVGRSNSLLSEFIYHLVMGFSVAGSQCHKGLYLWVLLFFFSGQKHDHGKLSSSFWTTNIRRSVYKGELLYIQCLDLKHSCEACGAAVIIPVGAFKPLSCQFT